MIRLLLLVFALLLAKAAGADGPPELTGYYRVAYEDSDCGTMVRSYVHPTKPIIQRRWFVAERAIVTQVIIRRGAHVYSHLWVSRLGAGQWLRVYEDQKICELAEEANRYKAL